MLDANFNASSRSNSPPNRSDPNEPGAIRAFFCISFISATFRGPPSAHRLKPTEPREPQPGHQGLRSHHQAIDPQNVKICPSDPIRDPRSAIPRPRSDPEPPGSPGQLRLIRGPEIWRRAPRPERRAARSGERVKVQVHRKQLP